jgi:hypothetical protein
MAKISKAGVYTLSMADYHGQPTVGPSVSSSGLRAIFTKSPKHFWAKSSLNPKAKVQKDTESFVLGRAAHHLLLGEDDFSSLFIVRPEEIDGAAWQGNRTACKKWMGRDR